MKPQSIITLLSILLIAGACSKGNYAQVEPDDMYFTHKDRKEVQSISAKATNNNKEQTANEQSVESMALNNEEAFYGASQNPDEISLDSGEDAAIASDDYYTGDYSTNGVEQAGSTPQVNNYNFYGNAAPYYAYPYNSGTNFSIAIGFSAFPISWAWYDPFSPFYDPFFYSRIGYYRPYGSFYYSYGYPTYCGPYYYDPYYSYCYGGSGYYPTTYYSGGSNYTVYNSNQDNGGRKQVKGPRKSRSIANNYADGSVNRRKNISEIRDDQGGRINPGSNGKRNYADVSSRPNNKVNVINRNNNKRDVSRDAEVVSSSVNVNMDKGLMHSNKRNINNRAINSSNQNIDKGNSVMPKNKTYVNRTSTAQTTRVTKPNITNRRTNVNKQTNRNKTNRGWLSNLGNSSTTSYRNSSGSGRSNTATRTSGNFNNTRSRSSYSAPASRSGSSYRSSSSHSSGRTNSMSRTPSTRSSSMGRSSSSRSSSSRSSSGRSSSGRKH